MENTGRILRGLTPTARRIIFGATADESVDAELWTSTQIDRAHLLMLAERGLVGRGAAAALLREIEALRERRFAPLRGRTAPRGAYLLYEDYLIERLGAATGGVLQTARSRNDLNATSLRLRLRAPWLRLLGEVLRLQAVMLRRAGRFAGVVMPAYTHFQAALPTTYGHYLAGVAQAFARDLDGLFAIQQELNRSPLGAGAGGGTTLPVDAEATARLLGFEGPALHSADAVAARDLVLRLLAAASVYGVTLSRLAADLLVWSTAEFGFLALPDELVGSSSMMPQKRNPFLLEHVQGRSAAVLGAFVSAATAMHAKPFANSVAVGGEGVANLWKPLQIITETTTLARLVVSGAAPQPAAMLRRAREGYVVATELANRLVTGAGVAFREAHRRVGSLIREAAASGESLRDAAERWRAATGLRVPLEGLEPAEVAGRANYGGGPGADSLAACLTALRGEWSRQAARRRAQARRWREAEAALDEAVRQFCAAAEEAPDDHELCAAR